MEAMDTVNCDQVRADDSRKARAYSSPGAFDVEAGVIMARSGVCVQALHRAHPVADSLSTAPGTLGDLDNSIKLLSLTHNGALGVRHLDHGLL